MYRQVTLASISIVLASSVRTLSAAVPPQSGAPPGSYGDLLIETVLY
jgi:hypothetical protein